MDPFMPVLNAAGTAWISAPWEGNQGTPSLTATGYIL